MMMSDYAYGVILYGDNWQTEVRKKKPVPSVEELQGIFTIGIPKAVYPYGEKNRRLMCKRRPDTGGVCYAFKKSGAQSFRVRPR